MAKSIEWMNLRMNGVPNKAKKKSESFIHSSSEKFVVQKKKNYY